MKRFIALLLIIASFGFTQKNPNMVQTKMWLRVDNVEKQNVFTRELAKKLIKAFQNGKITAYYPMDMDKPMSYSSFLAHYGAPQTEISTDITSSLSCPENTGLQLDPWLLSCLTRYLEIYETQGFNKVKSRYTHDIHYVRLIFPADCSYKGIDTYGPVFKWKDIIHIHDKIYNPYNYAMKYTPKDIFKLRLFNPTYIKKDKNDYWEKPSEAGHVERNKQLEKESNMWSN